MTPADSQNPHSDREVGDPLRRTDIDLMRAHTAQSPVHAAAWTGSVLRLPLTYLLTKWAGTVSVSMAPSNIEPASTYIPALVLWVASLSHPTR